MSDSLHDRCQKTTRTPRSAVIRQACRIRPMRMKATTIREEDSIRRCAAISSLGSFSSIRHVRLVIARLVILLIQKYPK